MYKLTVVTAALAAGLMNFAASAAHSEPLSFRIDRSPTPTISGPQKSKASGASKAEDKAVKKMAAANKVAAAKKAAAKKTTSAKAKKSAIKRKITRTKALIDTTTTASIKPVDAAKSAGKAPGGEAAYSAIVARYAASYGVPVSLAHAVITVESNYRPHLTGRAGEVGLMQIKPATARMMGYTGSVKGLYHPETNIKYGMKYLAMAHGLGGGTTCGTILKYNAGHAAKRMNPISSAYCSKVKVQMAALGTPA
jgi:soluble lytic murein transglycosylase-like protein